MPTPHARRTLARTCTLHDRRKLNFASLKETCAYRSVSSKHLACDYTFYLVYNSPPAGRHTRRVPKVVLSVNKPLRDDENNRCSLAYSWFGDVVYNICISIELQLVEQLNCCACAMEATYSDDFVMMRLWLWCCYAVRPSILQRSWEELCSTSGSWTSTTQFSIATRLGGTGWPSTTLRPCGD